MGTGGLKSIPTTAKSNNTVYNASATKIGPIPFLLTLISIDWMLEHSDFCESLV